VGVSSSCFTERVEECIIMRFSWQRREYKKTTGLTFNDDLDFLLHLYGKLGGCNKVADFTYTNQMTTYNILNQYLKFNRADNYRGKGIFFEKLANLRKDYTPEQITRLTSRQIAKIIKHPVDATRASLYVHGVKFKKARGKGSRVCD